MHPGRPADAVRAPQGVGHPVATLPAGARLLYDGTGMDLLTGPPRLDVLLSRGGLGLPSEGHDDLASGGEASAPSGRP